MLHTLFLLHLVLTISGENYTLWSSLLCCFLHPPAASFVLGTCSPQHTTTLLSDTLGLFFHPNKIYWFHKCRKYNQNYSFVMLQSSYFRHDWGRQTTVNLIVTATLFTLSLLNFFVVFRFVRVLSKYLRLGTIYLKGLKPNDV